MNKQLTILAQYQKLLWIRNHWGMGLIILTLSVFLIYSLLNRVFFSQGLAFVLNMMVGILGFIFVVFGFLMKDICLWSKQHFFLGYKV